jgi:acetoin utilization deacetylase AcuC-like enzyme
MSTALLFDESCLLHLTGDGHPERPSRLEAVRTQLKKDGIWQAAARIAPREATLEELCLVHTPA